MIKNYICSGMSFYENLICLCLHIQPFVLEYPICNFFLVSKQLSLDALENVFSEIRAKGVTHPKPVQFRLALRLICVAQYMTIPTTSNYDIDETPPLVSFIKANKEKCDVNINQDTLDQTALDVLSATTLSSLDICESNYFYYVAGWAVFKE